MEALTVYLRCPEIYHKNIESAALVDSYMADRVIESAPIETFLIGSDKKFYTGSTLLTLKHPAVDVLIIGTVPYHMLIANLYNLADQGKRVKINPNLLITDIQNPNFPEEFLILSED